MTGRRKQRKQTEVGDYRHDEERLNNPPAGLAAEVSRARRSCSVVAML